MIAGVTGKEINDMEEKVGIFGSVLSDMGSGGITQHLITNSLLLMMLLSPNFGVCSCLVRAEMLKIQHRS